MSEVKGTKALELWCKRLVKDCPDVHIDNMTTSWRNGIAFCALVHHFRPDLIDLSKLNPENIYENNQLAYNIAEKHLGIPSLLDPEDMVENDVPDRLSILTYLSQFYQRLGHTVNTKVSETDSKLPSAASTPTSTPIKFGKVALDKCTVCGLPVYLAQRLIVSQKLYHRRCFRCSTCLGHLNPKNFHVIETNKFSCDSCKNDRNMSKYLNNNDQMGMLAFTNDVHETSQAEPNTSKLKSRPQSILEKINMFENIDKDNVNKIDENLSSISLKDNHNNINKSNIEVNILSGPQNTESISVADNVKEKVGLNSETHNSFNSEHEKVYKTNKDKFIFLQTQLSDDIPDLKLADTSIEKSVTHINDMILDNLDKSHQIYQKMNDDENSEIISKDVKLDSNITDDSRLAQNNITITKELDTKENISNEEEIKICVPPRRKKLNSSNKVVEKTQTKLNIENVEYPDHLNPFSEDEDENEESEKPVKTSTNPFGSSDEEEETISQSVQNHPNNNATSENATSTPVKRLIKAYNPFWSDGEEPSSDEETTTKCSSMHKSPLTTSTPNLPGGTPRRRKPRAPAPPPIAERLDLPSTSMDDVASISSYSSHNSTIHSDQKSYGGHTPRLKKRVAPTPPDSLSTLSGLESLDRSTDSPARLSTDGTVRKKGPAPGLPLPERREVKLTLPPEELQVQLELLETQQLGLERQGVLLERMIRDKCEDGPTASPEEIEDLVIQLCELVNEKNDLFRKQTELMYIRRQQRLEQEQADIEHEIRVIQSRPAVNRIDADKAREEQLVCRLVECVRQRDELVQQLDAERRRETREDRAIAACIASRRAQRNSESNSSSMKSADAVSPVKKSKVKDKVKKQLKKAKHTLIAKKKTDEKPEKEKKPK
ncbi:MICAL-like protein 1 isoform X2 [Aricia agestis]|uniref:MICAL-like protein 1 isoform X2 n=1 Tax=Aricia agestis TaxID=91739 RepID=UPI001C204C92|nr:MICAL-like protein 1 isoform X2 [Aricia agestis]